MQLQIDFSPEIQQEIREKLENGMLQTAVFLTIKQLKDRYDLSLPDYNCMKVYTIAKSILRKKFPEFFPQMRLSL